jgi:hypothetical protein
MLPWITLLTPVILNDASSAAYHDVAKSHVIIWMVGIRDRPCNPAHKNVFHSGAVLKEDVRANCRRIVAHLGQQRNRDNVRPSELRGYFANPAYALARSASSRLFTSLLVWVKHIAARRVFLFKRC